MRGKAIGQYIMRFIKVISAALVLCAASVVAFGCTSDNVTALEGQVAKVQRGNLSVDITGVGNLALSQKVDLAFEMDGTVQEVLVKEADSVREGQILARLDTSAWQEQVTALEDKVTTAERNVTTKERDVTDALRAVTAAERKVTTAERNVTAARQNITTKKRDVLQAQINLNNAQLSLEQTEETSTDPVEIELKELSVELAKGRLADAQQAVVDAETTGITDAQQAVEDAKVGVEDAKLKVEDKRQAVDDANKALADAKANLAETQSASPEVKAPFTGFITKVNVVGGDEIKKGTIAMTIADPNKFEAEVMVSEKNYPKVSLGGTASVLVEAMQGVTLPATITWIAPSATIQSGVVNYKVRVELTSLLPLTQSGQPATSATGNVSGGGFSGRSGQASGSANMTQEQIDQIRQQRQQFQTGQGIAGQSQTRQSGGSQRSSSTTSAGNTRLAEGMTVTISIVTAEKENVLLVSTQAIIKESKESVVQVVKDGVIEKRPVQVGLSNWQFTEITDGLSEGEQVLVPKATVPTPTTKQGQQPPQGAVVPNLGRILR